MKKIVIITDVWSNVNGIVTSLKQVKDILEQQGYQVSIIHPQNFRSISLPTYPEIKLGMATRRRMEAIIEQEHPDYIHIATEGTLGLAARRACVRNRWRFSTYYHTDLPQYVEIRLRMFKGLTYRYLRWFHQASSCVMVSSPSMQEKLIARHFRHITLVPLGANTELFQRNNNAPTLPYAKPIFVYLGRIAPEKNIAAFLKADLPGTKLVIGDGPYRKFLQKSFPNAEFVGYKKEQELVDILSVSDALVFPSRTDTFGIAVLEAMGCGLPVAAYNVQGLKDIISHGIDGMLGEDLAHSAMRCLELSPQNCRKKALQYSAEKWVNNFAAHLPTVN